jgi:hypothetical protein
MRKKIITIAVALFGIAVGTAFVPNVGATALSAMHRRAPLNPPGCTEQTCQQNGCPNFSTRLCGTFPAPNGGTCYCYWAT